MATTTEQLNHAIIEFYDKLSSWEHSVVRDKGLSLPQVHAIELLGENGPMRMKELATKMGITTGTLTVQIDKMVGSELVERLPHEHDRRSILVALTPLGETAYHEHHNLHMQLTHELTADLQEEEVSQLLTLLQRINREF